MKNFMLDFAAHLLMLIGETLDWMLGAVVDAAEALERYHEDPYR